MNIFKRTYLAFGQRTLFGILCFSYFIFIVWSLANSYIGLLALRSDGIYPPAFEYWTSELNYQYFTSPLLIYVICGLIPFIIMMTGNSKVKRWFAITFWCLCFVVLGVQAVSQILAFHAGRLGL